ncbi:MAG: hypothetical protein AB7K24_00625 [Gemmataceae bacterium]
MDTPWWLAVVQWGFWAAILLLIMIGVARGTQRADAAAQENVLVYPTSVLYIGLMSSGFFLLFALLVLVNPNGSGSTGVVLVLLLLSLVGLPSIAEYSRVRHVLEDGGLRYQTLLGKIGLLAWSDVKQIRYSRKWFRLDSTGGESIRVSTLMVSMPVFAKVVLQEVPRHRIDQAAQRVLEDAAAGKQPTIWSK